MRVAVTGATGFIGGRIARRLSAAGHEVLGLGRRPSADVAAEVAYRRWDLGDPGMKAPAELADVDAVVHSAAHVADWGPDATFQLVTVDGTARLLDACRGARIVVVGSASVYDPYRVHPCAREEDAPVARYRNGYGRAKAAQERLVLARRPDALVLRPHAVYGPGDRTLLPRLIAARRHGRLLLPGGGRAPMSVTHVDTVADAVIAGLERPDVHGPVNVADRGFVRPCDLLADAFAALGLPTRIVAIPLPVAWTAARIIEAAWSLAGRRDPPPLTAYAVSHLAGPFILDVSRLERSLGIRSERHYRDAFGELAVAGTDALAAAQAS